MCCGIYISWIFAYQYENFRLLIYIYIYNCKNLNKLSFGNYKFIFAGNSIRETASSHNHYLIEKKNFNIFFQWTITGLKEETKNRKQKDMGKALVSKTDITSLSGFLMHLKLLHNSQNTQQLNTCQ